MITRIAVFTDNGFGKTNGVTTTLRALLRCAPSDIRPRVYTCADLAVEEADYLSLPSVGVGVPYYRGMRIYVPRLQEFRRRLAEDGIGVVHLTTPGPIGVAARYLAGRCRLPLVGSFHTHLAEYTTLLSGSPRLGRGMAAYTRWVYGRCHCVLVPSRDTKRHLESEGWDASRMSIWARGVDTRVFAPERRSRDLRERWRVCERRPAVLYAGRLSPEKGLALFQPLERLLHQNRVAHRLIFVGDGPMQAELHERFPDAVFTGRLPHEDLAVAMASADLFVLPSMTDTAGNVVLEAQASGLPVLVSDVGGPRENIHHGITGYVCGGGDAHDFCRRAADLLGDAAQRSRMAAAARRYAGTRSWAETLASVYDAYRAAASSPLRRPEPVRPGRSLAHVRKH